ncbi:MAG: S-methyl-5-thioribose-1-phosphate isomerase [Lawsonibacter sp.]|jgi:methylthioribose-1-phosphate isomerase|nr:S-methyl-5-thioribose-1-phosphate isomerase [Lawsonibacter sp.]MCI8989565.1 S-methyl-5-thioribose-1-phosphate isomerase [Lawsonibacter sp.]MCI9268135.1 S-methyl-5-thioribose-1-phosphate isomerase [Lawsonibacter sp.]
MEAIRWERNELYLLDQTRLPGSEYWLRYTNYRDAAQAIRTMVVRGAPAIGVAAAYAMVLAAQEYAGAADFTGSMTQAKQTLAGSRPTAVNLFWALDRMERCWLTCGPDLLRLEEEARTIHLEDIQMNAALSKAGAELVPCQARILTHCNAGALATGGWGTALGVIRTAHAQGKVSMVYADETRPLLQGARLTAYELVNDRIPVTLICDGMAGYLMAQGCVDLVVVGCDRMAANGDFANKIGTYSLAVLAKHHGIPFYTALPSSTIDRSLPDGSRIPVEQRDGGEVTSFAGVQTGPAGVRTWNPSFDVTPHELLTAAITERGVLRPPFDQSLARLFQEA